jgi:hypothetical protein
MTESRDKKKHDGLDFLLLSPFMDDYSNITPALTRTFGLLE